MGSKKPFLVSAFGYSRVLDGINLNMLNFELCESESAAVKMKSNPQSPPRKLKKIEKIEKRNQM